MSALAASLALRIAVVMASGISPLENGYEGKLAVREIVGRDIDAPIYRAERSLGERISVLHVTPHHNIFGVLFPGGRFDILNGDRFGELHLQAARRNCERSRKWIWSDGWWAAVFIEQNWYSCPDIEGFDIEPCPELPRGGTTYIAPTGTEPDLNGHPGLSADYHGSVASDFGCARLFPAHISANLLHGHEPLLHSLFELATHDVLLSAHDDELKAANYDSNERKGGDPNGRVGGTPCRTILGCLLLLAGAATLKIAFWIGDDPFPPRTGIVAAWFIGGIAAVAIMQGTALVLLGLGQMSSNLIPSNSMAARAAKTGQHRSNISR